MPQLSPLPWAPALITLWLTIFILIAKVTSLNPLTTPKRSQVSNKHTAWHW